MQTVLWILLCALVLICATEVFGRLLYGYRPPREAVRGVWVVALDDNAVVVRDQLEYYLSWIAWNAPRHLIVFVRGEGNAAAEALFDRYLGDVPEARLITERQITGILRR